MDKNDRNVLVSEAQALNEQLLRALAITTRLELFAVGDAIETALKVLPADLIERIVTDGDG